MKCLLLLLSLTGMAVASPLTLDRVLQQTAEHHPKMRGARLLRSMAEAKVLEKEGAFDPSLFMGTDFLRYNSPSAPGKAKFSSSNVLGFQVQDIEGWKLVSGYRLNRQDTKSPASLTGEGGEFFVEFKMPLLRGLGTNEKQTQLAQAEVGRQLAEALAQITRLEVLLVASVAYWDWCAACTEWKLIQRNLLLAEERAGQVQKRVEAGDLPRIDGVEARQEVERRREALAKAQRNVEKALFKLSLYLWNSQGQAESLPSTSQAVLTFPQEMAERVLGSTGQGLAQPVDWDHQEILRAELQAVRLRPELRHIRFQQEVVELDRRLAENDQLPALDLSLGPGLDTGNQGIGLSYKVGLELTIPLATRNADGRLQGARLKTDKLELEQVLEIQRILSEVRDAASLIATSRERLGPALESLRLAQQLEEAERIRFELGDSTLFLVNQRERATLVEAQKLVEIWVDGLKGKAFFEASVGRL